MDEVTNAAHDIASAEFLDIVRQILLINQHIIIVLFVYSSLSALNNFVASNMESINTEN